MRRSLPDPSRPLPNKDGLQARFVTGSTMRHVVVMTASGSVGLTFMFLVDFLALYWVGQLDDTLLLAGMGYAAMVTFLMVSVALGMMISGVALVSRHLGAGSSETARDYATAALIFTFVIQLTLSGLSVTFRHDLLRLAGAEGEVLEIAAHVLSITLMSLPIIALGVNSAGLLRAVGDAWRSMLVTLVAGMVMMVLNPLLIVTLGWGVTGAAWSLVISRVIMAGLGLYWLIRHHGLLKRPSFGALRRAVRPYFAIAVPGIATQASPPAGQWMLTLAMAPYGPEAVAAMAVAMRLMMLVFGGIYGLSGAIGGIIGQNYGARRIDRVRRAYLDSLIFCTIYTLIAWLLMMALTGPLIRGFGLEGPGIEVMKAFTFWVTLSFLLNGVLFVAGAAFNNLGKPTWATWSAWLRDGVLVYPLALLLGQVWGGPGAMLGYGLAAVFAGGLAGWIAWRLINRLLRDTPPDIVDPAPPAA